MAPFPRAAFGTLTDGMLTPAFSTDASGKGQPRRAAFLTPKSPQAQLETEVKYAVKTHLFELGVL